ncbi:glycosyltransferase [Saccharolobus islandicus]|uniref:Glycosyltransferases involved in cell wall biogenesis n=1 Tax=Saccharolobus islandicus LAL14/1 TaxID=1241935 RepID=M9UCK0_SACIS|nr:glycosyltransferase [Sulfolobus islandicus]AGJ62261.1 Glycosyltransferases involved in cell wall biogenesis [Sulfolobus islandicus LAL14/1]
MKSAVIITVYKRYKYINEALNSVLSQTVKPDQIIIVADNPKMLSSSINTTVIEADYPQLGKKIFEAIKALGDDIDIVYFLEDDDMFHKNKIEYINKIFEKRRDIVTIHNSRELVDEYGNQLSSSYDIPFEVLIHRNNFRKINQQYPLGLGNNSSYSIRRKFLERIKESLSNINLALDTTLLYLSLEHNNLLHIPEKLTIYRVGTGVSTYSKVANYSKFLENKNKLVCYFNRVLEDFRYLESILTNCKQCKKEIQRTILFLELYLSAEDEVFKCDYKAQLPPLNSLFFSSIKYYLYRSISTKDLYNITKGVLGQIILGKKKVSEMRSKKGF